jgi:N-succinyldiaminopimelate aminotransferase
MNPDLARLQPYPFERLRQLLAGNQPPAELPHINLSIGEPKHATPKLIFDALTAALPTLASYPLTLGTEALRESIAAWLMRRHSGATIDPATQVMPVAGSREALFAFAQTVVDRTRQARVVMPNPFYQIYEGAALLAGAEPLFLPCTPENGFRMDFASIDVQTWAQVQLVYVCSPGNPHGRVMQLAEWRELFDLADRHGFIIASDECYSEIYFDEAAPPLGGLQAAAALGRTGFERLVAFGSLSKRSNAPGLRSGFVAGDARLLKAFLLYRTYHGSAMSPLVQRASIAAWSDEAHVQANRDLYRSKFAQVTPLLADALDVRLPDAGFYLWAAVPRSAQGAAVRTGDDVAFALQLLAQYNVAVLPGSLLAREAQGCNPGAGRIRMALVAPTDDCIEAARRIHHFTLSLRDNP